MADFPSSVKTFPTLIDLVDSVLAAHQNERADEITAIETWLSLYSYGADGFGLNYLISPSVTSNNLNLAIQDMYGNTPTANSPVIFRLGGTIYKLTSAVTFAKNAGTNWMNLGGAELAAQPTDLFVYAIAETGASAGLKFGYSRIPYARTMGDFINTNTNEKYIAGNWTNFNSTNVVRNIGRFRAQLSAAASYNWSIASSVVVNRPIYETDWLAWSPQLSASGSMTYTSTAINLAQYKLRMDDLSLILDHSGTTGGTASVSLIATAPFESANVGTGLELLLCQVADGTSVLGYGFISASTPDLLVARRYDGANFGLGAGRFGRLKGGYKI